MKTRSVVRRGQVIDGVCKVVDADWVRKCKRVVGRSEGHRRGGKHRGWGILNGQSATKGKTGVYWHVPYHVILRAASIPGFPGTLSEHWLCSTPRD